MEHFKVIKGYEGLYEISNKGVVKSLARKNRIEDKFMKIHLSTSGYPQVLLTKKGKSKTYQLIGFNGTKKYVVDNVVDFMSDEEQNDTRKYSTQLRHGIHPKYIIEQIEKYATISSLDKVIGKILRNYLGEEQTKSEKECPTCHSKNLRNESGCITCNDCGWSKCS